MDLMGMMSSKDVEEFKDCTFAPNLTSSQKMCPGLGIKCPTATATQFTKKTEKKLEQMRKAQEEGADPERRDALAVVRAHLHSWEVRTPRQKCGKSDVCWCDAFLRSGLW